MAGGNSTLPICFFKFILQTNLQTIKIPNKFTRSHGVGLPNPMFIKPPDGTKWKMFWKNINGEIWFEKGWSIFTQNYSLQHGCLVVFKYKEGTSELDVVILGQNALEIDYDSKCDTVDILNVDDSDDESDEILNEWLNRKKVIQKLPLVSTRAHKKVRGEIEKNSERTSSLNRPKECRAREVAEEFISNNPFFTIWIKPSNLAANRLSVPNLQGVIENKKTNVMIQIGERSWNLNLLPSYNNIRSRRLSAGWSLFARESGLQPGDVCIFELINKKDLVFKVHVF
ncbi:unnamed protein product [Vicia faba]|uniref:TF-B3 domain-containing protein n=1 Tax=Vicia faba TaxID=3906 RepID=A0AAV0ZIX9_VICFA|nr:unnamed protein product [Vicia faba]